MPALKIKLTREREHVMPGELWIQWTIRISMLCYAAYLILSVTRRPGENRSSLLRFFWTAGCVAFLAHFIAAFEFAHGWSNQHAVEDTARQTRELLGWEFGKGIYFSYLFLVLWIVDVVWWGSRPNGYSSRPIWLSFLVNGYILFIAFNGCIIFEPGVTRWGGLFVIIVLAVLLFLRRRPFRAVTCHE